MYTCISDAMLNLTMLKQSGTNSPIIWDNPLNGLLLSSNVTMALHRLINDVRLSFVTSQWLQIHQMSN